MIIDDDIRCSQQQYSFFKIANLSKCRFKSLIDIYVISSFMWQVTPMEGENCSMIPWDYRIISFDGAEICKLVNVWSMEKGG